MSRLRRLAARMLGGWLPSLSARRRDWVQAALAELPDVPDGLVLGWSMGAAAMAVGDMFEQAFLPWRREQGSRPPAGFAALVGLLMLLAPINYVAAAVIWPGWTFGTIGTIASIAGIGLSLWLNLAAIVKADALGGLLYAVGIRVLPRNLALILFATILAFLAFLAAHGGLR
ncbi:MAG: hypothetical protein QOG13_2618 [Sphingomonadales bacterium]|jgi:hypothetical protein|nr:hypothetical protein [Sphingomonadales bacterium]